MFSWLKRRFFAPAKPKTAAGRSTPAAGKAAPAGKRGGSAPPGFLPSGPAALPEVLGEGNTQADWSAWEDSMTALDSQMQEELVPSARVHVREPRPSQQDDLDAFASVRRKRDV